MGDPDINEALRQAAVAQIGPRRLIAAGIKRGNGQLVTRIDMANPDGDVIRTAADNGRNLELHDSTRPDVAPIVLDDFLMAVMRGEVA
ncbi:hypothetical protein [Streptomyces sp. NPDC056192]|uniref:hypothetical protein n=1 Tax=Streptomyces sp. NPDC056192 TaxID=3345743 RepID=UPI0035D5AEFD